MDAISFLGGRMHFILAQQQDGSAGGAIAVVMMLIELAITVLFVASLWKAFVKAGEPGWAAIIPIYNAVILLKVVGKPIWWIVFLIIPCLIPIFHILTSVAAAKSFGKGAGFAIGLILLPIIFWPLLGFGDAKYVGATS
jgi:hypothetical protein